MRQKAVKATHILTIIIILLFSTTNLFATGAALTGMGLRDEIGNSFDWMLTNNIELIKINPAYILKQQEVIYYNTSQTGGNYGDGGLLLKYTDSFAFLFSTGNPINASFEDAGNDAELNNEQFNLKAAIKFDSFGMGFSLSQARSMDRETYNNSDTSRNYFNARIGSYIDITKTFNIDLAAFVAIPYVRVIANDIAVFESDAAIDYGANLRFNVAITKLQQLHIFAGMDIFNHNGKSIDPDLNLVTAHVDKITEIAFGISDEIQIKKDIKAIVGLVFNGHYHEVSTLNFAIATLRDYDRETLTLVLGLTTEITDGFKVSLGMNKRFIDFIDDYRYTDTSKDVKTNLDAAANLFLGISATFKNLTLDLALNNDLFSTGPNFISGDNTQLGRDNVTTNFSVKYTFDTGTDQDSKPVKKNKRRRRRRR